MPWTGAVSPRPRSAGRQVDVRRRVDAGPMTTMATVPGRAPTVPSSEAGVPLEPSARRRRARLEALVALNGVAVAALLGADDPFPWPQVRSAIALAITAGAWWSVRHAGR